MRLTRRIPVFVTRIYATRDGRVESRVSVATEFQPNSLPARAEEQFPVADGYRDHGGELYADSIAIPVEVAS